VRDPTALTLTQTLTLPLTLTLTSSYLVAVSPPPSLGFGSASGVRPSTGGTILSAGDLIGARACLSREGRGGGASG